MVQKLKTRLNILRLSTNQLIDHFYLDLLQHQREESEKEKAVGSQRVGELIVSVGYIKETSAIEVNVVQAKDIGTYDNRCYVYTSFLLKCLWYHVCIKLSPIGNLQEPYIKLRLSSICKFADRHWKTRPVKGGKQAPSFSEEFNL